MSKQASFRWVFVFAALLSAGFLAAALALEHLGGMEPCPLCWVQRWAYTLVGAVALLALIHRPGPVGARIYGGALGVSAVAGLLVAARHIQVQLSPPTIGCGVGWSTMMERLPFHELLLRAMEGSAECAQVDAFLGVPLPWWTGGGYAAIAFLGLAVATGALRSR